MMVRAPFLTGRPRSGDMPSSRLRILWSLFYIGAGLLVLRLLHIQVLQNIYYTKAAEKNRTQTLYQRAPRGRVFDGNRVVLATSRPAFNLVFFPGTAGDGKYLYSLARELAPTLKREPGELLSMLRESAAKQRPVRLQENLRSRDMFRLSELKTLFHGINLVVEAGRYYPRGRLASHLLGYMGQIGPKEWPVLRMRGYRADSIVGKAGIEKLLERELRGSDGGIQLEVDAQSRLQGVLRRVPWSPGSDVYLTIDSRLQKAAEEGLRFSVSRAGAVVVLDPMNGGVLALASLPDFDPNLFVSPKDPEVVESLKSVSEFNLAVQGTFPPGSIFKIVTAAAALNEGRIAPDETFFCPGYYRLRTRTFKCWKKGGHKKVDYLDGVVHSCDVYFYNIGLKAGGELIEEYEKRFGFGELSHIPLRGEKKGLVFGPGSMRARGKGWYAGETFNLAFGQGEILVTPVQMANLISAVANRGTLFRPQFIDKVVSPDGRVLFQRTLEVLKYVDLKPETWQLLQTALEEVVLRGTGKGCRIRGVQIAGKTGTAQNPLGDDHSWFVAYAGLPGNPPSIALAVLVQFGGHGAEAALPIARKIIRTAFREGIL